MNFEKSQIKSLLVLALLALTLPLAAWLASRPQLIQKRAACAVNLKLEPASGSHAINNAFSVNLQIEAGTAAAAVAGADVNLSFDASKLKINSITLASDLNSEMFKTINNTNGTARISAVKMSAGGVTGTFNFATIAFEGIAVTSAPVAVTIDSVNIGASGEGAACSIGTKTNGSYTITDTTAPTNTPGPTNTPIPTPTGTVAPTPTGGAAVGLNLKFRINGIDSPRTAETTSQIQQFKVTLVGPTGITKTYTTSAIRIGDGGVVEIDPNIIDFINVHPTLTSVPTKLFIKWTKSLQKKYEGITITRAGGDIDLTTRGPRYYLEPGDLAISGTSHDQQDGVVNSYDAVYITDTQTGCITKPDDPVCLAKADLNLDGLIDPIDIGLINETVYSKWEDEVQ